MYFIERKYVFSKYKTYPNCILNNRRISRWRRTSFKIIFSNILNPGKIYNFLGFCVYNNVIELSWLIIKLGTVNFGNIWVLYRICNRVQSFNLNKKTTPARPQYSQGVFRAGGKGAVPPFTLSILNWRIRKKKNLLFGYCKSTISFFLF